MAARELSAITDEKEIEDRFYKDLEFGTGGLRGVMGAGANRMNKYTVSKATKGLADYLNSKGEGASVAIGYDSRINSDVFSAQCAEVLAANGITVWMMERSAPTPLIMHTRSDDPDGLFARARVAVDYLLKRFNKGEKVALVSHGAFLTYIVFDLMGFDGKLPVFDVNFKNTGITRVLIYEKGTNPYGDVVFDYINSTEHLFGE